MTLTVRFYFHTILAGHHGAFDNGSGCGHHHSVPSGIQHQVQWVPYTIHHTPYTIQLTPCTIHSVMNAPSSLIFPT
ncbi:hypothetical protein EON63_06975, partial [archaeon]